MPCLICGDERTIEAHLIPRALYRALAGDEQHAREGSRFKAGMKLQGKGVFDKTILCHTHEKALDLSDDYGVKFVKSFFTGGVPTVEGHLWTLRNPKPDLLVKFMASLIWRRGVSMVGRGPADLGLGAFEPSLRKLIFFDDKTYRPPMVLMRIPVTSQGQVLHELMYEPSRGNGFGSDVWTFYALGCQIMMNLNPYNANPFPGLLVANNANPLNALNCPPEELCDNNGAFAIAVNMFLDPKTGLPNRDISATGTHGGR